MGISQFSKHYFEEHITEARALTGVLKVIYRDSDIKLIVATARKDPGQVLRDYLLGSVRFVVSYRKCSGYAISSPIDSEEMSRKLLSYEKYESLRKLLYSLRNFLAAGSAPSKPREATEECVVCMDADVEVVLPCSHSFCAKCAKDWRETNPTCPSCRQELIENEGEEWQLEDWNEDDLKQQFLGVTQEICDFLDDLPPVPSSITETHIELEFEEDAWNQVAYRDEEAVVEGVVLDESKEKPSKFMRP